MPRGSKPGERRGGRKPGSKNKNTEEIIKRINLHAGITPLEYMFQVLRQPEVEQMEGEEPVDYLKRLLVQEEQRRWAAVSAAPFVHARLANVQVKEDPDQFKQKHEDMDLMETARRMAFIFATADEQQETAH